MSFLNSNSIITTNHNSSELLPNSIVYETSSTLIIRFNTDFKDLTDCSTVAVVFDTPQKFKELHLGFSSNLKLNMELVTIENGKLKKFKEICIEQDTFVNILNISNDIKQIVFKCYVPQNFGKNGLVKITKITR